MKDDGRLKCGDGSTLWPAAGLLHAPGSVAEVELHSTASQLLDGNARITRAWGTEERVLSAPLTSRLAATEGKIISRTSVAADGKKGMLPRTLPMSSLALRFMAISQSF